jgi:exodeoxyribonuclease VII large subunit
MLFPAYLQGDLAVSSIQKQLERIHKVKHHFDVVVIVRGGGGEVGMSCYNNYELCRSIARFELPILTGIGHSTNFTVAEMIAFRNAITPTELADFLIQSFHDFSIPLKEAAMTAKKYCKNILQFENNNFNQELRAFRTNTQLFRNKATNQLQQLSQKVSLMAKSRIPVSIQELKNQKGVIHQLLKQKFTNEAIRIAEHRETSIKQVQRFASEELNKLNQLEKHIDLLNPIHILKRGYSITTCNGKALNVNAKIEIGQILLTKTAGLIIKSEIIEIDKNE